MRSEIIVQGNDSYCGGTGHVITKSFDMNKREE